MGLTGWFSLRNGTIAVNNVTSQLRMEVLGRIKQQLHTYLETPHLVNAISVDAIRRFDLWNPNNMIPMRSYFFWQLQQFPTVNYISFGGERKEYAGADYKDDGTVVIEITDKSTNFINTIIKADKQGNPTEFKEVHIGYDPRIRPWYKTAKAAGKSQWNKIYQYYIQPSLGISASQPFYDKNGTFRGVVSTDLFLSEIGDFLQSLKIGKSGKTFIIERSGLLVASSTSENPFLKSKDGKETLILKAIESSVPLKVESVLGAGSIFYFDLDLPVASQYIESDSMNFSDKISGFRGETYKILLVDDRRENRNVLRNMLEPLGFKIMEACNGQEGLDQAAYFKPDLIITDLVMPVMGLKFCRKRNNKVCKNIFCG
ncbi:cache domain-containing protein [Microcoleus sp. FACHB-68]|uniref:cache domain-containing protein n=1 Tax=Microcoleus sp. FACHB-68 TaxID=2692826 RepID=UPI00321F8325